MHMEHVMGYDRLAPKRPINVSLNDDLVRQARQYTRNLSGTLEDLLGDFVERERARPSTASMACSATNSRPSDPCPSSTSSPIRAARPR